MTSVNAQAAHDHSDLVPASRTGGRFMSYVSALREAFAEALEMTQEARRKYPFADV